MRALDVRRRLGLGAALYVPHLIEEAMTGMHDDPLIVAAWAPLSNLSPRHAAYLVFQVTFALALGATYLVLGGRNGRLIVLSILAFALLAEAHHVVRALLSLRYNSGLFTSLPLPVAGALLGRALASDALHQEARA